jgi:hypothetical protein
LSTGAWLQPKVGLQLSVVQTLPSLQSRGLPAVQVPFWQVSLPLHASLSAQDVPFSTGVVVHPVAGLHESVVQGLPSSQLGAVPAVQTPAWQVSAPSQASPSLHEVPLSTGVCVQPNTVSQPSVVQGLLSLQLSGVPVVHTPLWQVSPPLQTFVSLHDVPLSTGVFTQPEEVLQESVVQTLPSLQLRAVPAVHVPLWQVSSPLQGLLSAQVVPLVTAGLEQMPEVHTSLVHGLPSEQSAATAQGWQPAIGVFVHPLMALQASVVQALLSLQLSGVPDVQLPLWQVSAPLQTSPSAHEVPLATAVAVQPVAALQPSVVHGLPSLHVSGVPAVQAPS